MPRKMDIDYKQLMKMVQDGVPQVDIMTKFGFKTATQLKVALANAAIAEGKIPGLVGGRGVSSASSSSSIRVNKRGSLVIPKQMVETLGFKIGDEFTVRQVKYGIQVRKAGVEIEGEE